MSSQFHSSQIKTSLCARELFRSYAHLPWSMLLDSGTSNHIDARYDIIVFDPVITLVSDDVQTCITDKRTQTIQVSTENPFDLLQTQLQAIGFSAQVSDLPFSGGALGLFSYDLGRHCEKLNANAIKDIDVPVMAVGIYEHALVHDLRSNAWTLISRTNSASHNERLESINQVLLAVAPDSTFTCDDTWQHQLTQHEYNSRFKQVQHHLRQGDCYQINLTQRFEMSYTGDEYNAYVALATANETPFSAFIRLDDHAILSLSPERFLQTKRQLIETKPIKGTIARSKDPQADKKMADILRASEKDQSENLMIVDLLRNDIGRSAVPGSVTVPKLFDIESFENVHHLVSTIVAKLPDNISPLSLLRDAFPGGSITGAPKISAMNIIDRLEPSRRSVYCGSIGYISADGTMDTSITIRTVLTTKGRLYCWAGGGIVADSTAQSEYQECFDKLASIMPVLANYGQHN